MATAVGDEVAEADFKPVSALSFGTETLRSTKSVHHVRYQRGGKAWRCPPFAMETRPTAGRSCSRGTWAAADRPYCKRHVDRTVGAR